MIEILLIYKWTLFSGVLSACSLALLGSQLAARNQSVQSLVVSQSASFGVFLGLFIQHSFFDQDYWGEVLPIVFGLVMTSCFYFFCERGVSKKSASRNTHYLALFAFLMAMTYLMISLAPNVESHMLASFFGDLALISNQDAILVALISFISLIFIWLKWNEVSAWSFEEVTFETKLSTNSQKKTQRFFVFYILLLLTVSVQLMGLLFTLSCLFLPVMILSQRMGSCVSFKWSLLFTAGFGSLLGFVFSLWSDDLPTVPCISFALVLVGMLIITFRKK